MCRSRSMMTWILVLILVCGLMAGRSAEQDDVSDVILNPWWGLTLFAGETVVLQCGTFTGQDPGSVVIQWLDPQGNPVNNGSRFAINRRDTLPPDHRKPSAYAVSTLSIPDVSSTDGGVYACAVNRTSHSDPNMTVLVTRNVTVTVLSPDRGCSFEGDDLCGWRIDNASSVQWHRHQASDRSIIDRAKGPRYDHTYGASSQQGHFLDVDVGHHESPNKSASALLLSPFYKVHADFRCLQFWYFFEGRDQERLTVSIRGNDSSNQIIANITESQGSNWILSKINIPPQTQGYQVALEVVTCDDKCKNAVTALDDVRVTETKCSEDSEWPDSRLQVRLTGGPDASQGRVEVQHEAQWGSVCSRRFGIKEGIVICRKLGYSYAEFIRNVTRFGAAPEGQIIWLQRLSCTGKESDLGGCLSKSEHWAETDCSPAEDAGVICSNEPVLTFAPSSAEPPAPTSSPSSSSAPTSSSSSSSSLTTPPSSPPSPSSPPTLLTTLSSSSIPFSSLPSSTITSNSSSSPPASSLPPSVPSSTTPPPPTPPTSSPPHSATGSIPSSSKIPSSILTSATTMNTTIPALVSFKPELQDGGNNNAGVAIGIIIALAVAASVLGAMLYKNRKKGKKNAYITFGNPSYSRENLPANDFNLDSPLTLSSSGYTVLA